VLELPLPWALSCRPGFQCLICVLASAAEAGSASCCHLHSGRERQAAGEGRRAVGRSAALWSRPAGVSPARPLVPCGPKAKKGFNNLFTPFNPPWLYIQCELWTG